MDLDHLKPLYFPSETDIDSELFYPISRSSTRLDCMVGYFTSGVLAELAISLASYLNSDPAHKMRFLISPNLADADLRALEDGLTNNANVSDLLFPNHQITESQLKHYSLRALSYLVNTDRLELKVAIKESGLFHTKCWLFETKRGGIAIHGSSNATASAFINNFEQLMVNRAWLSNESHNVYKELETKFTELWSNGHSQVRVFPVNDKTTEALKTLRTNDPSPESAAELSNKLWDALHTENWGVVTEVDAPQPRQTLEIPIDVDYRTGRFSHQGGAVDAWARNNYSGMFAIATGGGKSVTSLIGASQLAAKAGPLLIVIAVPTRALLNQWDKDIRRFSAIPINTYEYSAAKVRQELKRAIRRLKHQRSLTEIFLVTHNKVKSDAFDFLDMARRRFSTLLIADEVHNLGADEFRSKSPAYYDYRLGLSATPVRQYDDKGTDFLYKYFGQIVYEYPLEDAIGKSLVPYRYYVHQVYLSPQEQDDFFDLTEKIRRLTYTAELPAGHPSRQRWERLCIQRRTIIESASSKARKLHSIIANSPARIERTLIFCTDKNSAQLQAVNKVLTDLNIRYHQVTARETGRPRDLADILTNFSTGTLQVLTSMRVLDEGFNVPQTETAYLLANNTVRRQWVQRLGRILRRSPETGKQVATLHDFAVLPVIDAGGADEDLRSLVSSEYQRIRFFNELSKKDTIENTAEDAMKSLLRLMEAA